MKYNLYKNDKGRIQQVPAAQNDPKEDIFFPDPLEAKGNVPDVAPFVIQEQKQFDLIKQNETDQARFQTKKLQNSNYQITNFRIQPTDSGATESYYIQNYNQATAVGTALDDCVMFGTDTVGVANSKYYNIVYINARYEAFGGGATDFLVAPSYIEFYPMQKINTGDFGGKIPRQIEQVSGQSTALAITSGGTEVGVQSFGVDVFNENAYYTQTADLKGIRCVGIALKRISLNFSAVTTLSNMRLTLEVGYDLNTEGNNY